MRDRWLKIRLNESEHDRLRQLAAEHRCRSVSDLVRRAIEGAATRQPLLTPNEIDQLDRTREQLRMAGVNLNALLREVHLFENGVSERGPTIENYRATQAELSAALAKVTDFLRRMP